METATFPASSLRPASALLFCRLCQTVYRQPKILPCLHSFCKSCLMDIVSQEEDNEIVACPMCAYKVSLPSSGVEELQDNCFLSRMCQEYLTEVQSHFVARALHSDTNRSLSELTLLPSKLTEETTKSSLPLSGHHNQEVNLANEDLSSPATLTDASSTTGYSPINALEAINNMSKLQAKIMSLQGEALRVTYAIDHVNQSMSEWHQHKEDLKRAVQRRSSQFQFFIKRMEHQLITQIDGKHVDDDFYAESDKRKTELRKILRNVLHEVGVLKDIQELGKDYEIRALSSNLLGKSVGLANVLLRKYHFDMNAPAKSIQEIVAEYFGEINLNFHETNIFDPEVLDFKDLQVGDLDEDISRDEFCTRYNENCEPPELGEEEISKVAPSKSTQRSFSDSSSVSYGADNVLEKDRTRQHLVQFQNARETLKTRRREILAHGQQAREDASLLWDETRRYPRSAMRRERVQSLDRTVAPVIKTGSRTGLPFKSTTETTTIYKDKEKASENSKERLSDPYTYLLKFQQGQIPEDINVPSPVLEEVSLPKTSTKVLIKQTSDPYYTHGLPSSLEDLSSSDSILQTNSHSQTEHLSSIQLLNPYSSSLFRGRRHSSDLPQQHDKTFSRLHRRALSSAPDRKTKMEFLRETWQKRKEILIQNEGFVSSDGAIKHGPKHESQPHALKIPDSHGSPHETKPVLNLTHDTEASNRADDDLTNVELIQESEASDIGTEEDKTWIKSSPGYVSDVQSHTNVRGLRLGSQKTKYTENGSRDHTPSQLNLTQTASTASPHFPASSQAVLSSEIKPTGSVSTESSTPTQEAQETTQRTTTGTTKLTTSQISKAYSNQTENQTAPSEMVQSVSSNLTSPQQSRRFPLNMGSRFIEGVNRRHTIELGKTSLQDSLQGTSSNTPPSDAVPKESMNQIQAFGLYQCRAPESSYASPEMMALMPSQDAAVTEYTTPGQGVPSETTRVLAFPNSSSSSSPLSPASPNINEGVQRIRMRELARKKRERWRHLTIH